MHLASISSQEDNDRLEKHIKDFGKSNFIEAYHEGGDNRNRRGVRANIRESSSKTYPNKLRDGNFATFFVMSPQEICRS